ncbi:hypothetical protein JTB14_024818 [Gonioctena quinquepunctata]|nr:hypothetical protein JTB14_024818 [Gonioctena quinquepunctata]
MLELLLSVFRASVSPCPEQGRRVTPGYSMQEEYVPNQVPNSPQLIGNDDFSLHGNINQWRAVLFSDEIKICPHGNDRIRRTCRRAGERYAQCCMKERISYGGGGGSCMLWGGKSFEGKTDLVFIEWVVRRNRRGLTADRDINQILADHVVSYAGFIGAEFRFMDNAAPYTAGIVRRYLAEVGIPVIEWPACSPN